MFFERERDEVRGREREIFLFLCILNENDRVFVGFILFG